MSVLPARRPRPRHRAARPRRSARLARPAGAVLVLVAVAGAAHTSAPDSVEPVRNATERVRVVALDSNRSDLGDRARTAARVSRDAPRPELTAEPRPDPGPDSEPDPGPDLGPEPADAPADPRQLALAQLALYGWDSTEFACLDQLWIGESNWDHRATNPTSGAYGIPQALPPQKMASAGPDWRTNPATQIEWGLEYIELSYGTPCAANEFKLANGWY